MKVALVHDYLKDFGGAERVLEVLSEIYPDAPIYTAFYKQGSSAYERFKNKRIVTSWAQKIPFFAERLHSPFRFLAPFIWGSFDFSDYDLVIASSSWYVTRGFKKGPKTIEICYCHTPPRYLYGYPTSVDWQKYALVRAYALVVNHFMRVYDFEAAGRVNFFIANSKEVAGRIKKFYRRDSTVIYPPVDIEKFEIRNPKSEKKGKYFLVVSRLVAAKNVELVVELCKKLKLPLKVVGTGRELQALKELASSQSTMNSEQSTIEFLGDVEDSVLVKLYQYCRAVIFPASQEDFGLVPVEAMAAGKPVIALSEGGVKETVVDQKTGLLVEDLAQGAFTIALNVFMAKEKKGEWDAQFIRKQAEKFSKERFKREITAFVKSKVK